MLNIEVHSVAKLLHDFYNYPVIFILLTYIIGNILPKLFTLNLYFFRS